jgi:hypothetical protein
LKTSVVQVSPVSHSLPIDSSELCARPGRMCASLPVRGSWGRLSWHASVVDCSMSPFGNLAVMVGLVLPVAFVCGLLGCR